MNWQSVSFDWNRARAFLVTAEEGSLSAAARALGMSQPTLSRQVAALEAEVGVVLFERQKLGLELTPTGLELLQHVKHMANAANEFSLSAAGRSEALDGTVSISTTEVTANYALPPLMLKLRALYPGIQLEVISSHETSDLKRREADIAIRSFRPEQDDLIIRKLRNERGRLYASREYLQKLGNPQRPEDFSAATLIAIERGSITRYMDTLAELGYQFQPEQVGLLVNNLLVHWEMVKAGLGIGVMVDYVGDREPGVVSVLPDLPPWEGELWLVTHRELRTNRRVRVVFDFLAEHLSQP
jgi:DNA-binding transcriptional LysR family regulator